MRKKRYAGIFINTAVIIPLSLTGLLPPQRSVFGPGSFVGICVTGSGGSLLCGVALEVHGNMPSRYVKLKGLDPSGIYEDEVSGKRYKRRRPYERRFSSAHSGGRLPFCSDTFYKGTLIQKTKRQGFSLPFWRIKVARFLQTCYHRL